MATFDHVVFICNEATVGSLETPEATEAVELTQCDFSLSGNPIRRPVISPQLDRKKPAKPGGILWNLSLAGEVKAQTDATTPGEMSETLQAAGFTQTIGAADVTYTLTDDPNAAATDYSVTIHKEEGVDGNCYKAHGCRIGGLEFSFGPEQALSWTANAIGGYNVPAAVTSNTADTPVDALPFVYMHDTNPFTTHSYAAIIRSGTISVGMEAAARPHMGGTAAHGYHKWPCILRRDPTTHVSFSFEVEAVDESAFALFTKWRAATDAATTLIFYDGARTLTFTLTDTVFDAPTITAGHPNLFTLTGTASNDGTNGALIIEFK